MTGKLACVAIVLSVVSILLVLKDTVDSRSSQLKARRGGPQSAPAADPFLNRQAVSRQDCKHELQPRHLHFGSARSAQEPVDCVFTTAAGYTTYQTRAFLKTFRINNREARIVVLIAPDHVQSPSTRSHFSPQLCTSTLRACGLYLSSSL